MSLKKETFLLFATLGLLLCAIFLLENPIRAALSNLLANKTKFTVVIDAGHGGFDSGKVGIDGTLEKDINLSIAKKLEALLLANDIHVIMTRIDDHDLCTESSAGKKRQDMTNRVEIMNASNADCIVSIHQNSYPDSRVHGAQVFYYTNSISGKSLATLIQKSLITRVDPSNHREEKSDNNYFILKNSRFPTVIVECGFLSSLDESKKLVDDTYQQKLAWAIHLGILQYLNGTVPNSHILK